MSIPQVCGDWGQTQAAYRFLGNEDTSGQSVLQAHADASMKRMSAHQVVLCLQDTSELDFEGKQAEGLRPLNDEAQWGMLVHPIYAVTPQREPLGLINSWNWAREFRPQGGGSRPGVDESLRWVESYAHWVGLAPQLAQTRLVCVGDRESDMLALFERGQREGRAVDKTRLLEFGRFAGPNRKQRGLGKPQTFTFLGFIFICGKSRCGACQLQRRSRGDRMRATLQKIKAQLRKRMHDPIPSQGRWLRSVVQGYLAYHAVPTNMRAIAAFRYHVTNLWRRMLLRRSQKDAMTWKRMTKLAEDWLPPPRILHPWPDKRFDVKYPRWEPGA